MGSVEERIFSLNYIKDVHLASDSLRELKTLFKLLNCKEGDAALVCVSDSEIQLSAQTYKLAH